MRISWTRLLIAAALAALTARAGAAQAVTQFWPEVDYYQELADHSRLFFQAMGAFGSDSVGDDKQLGANFDFSVQSKHRFARLLGARVLEEDRTQPLQFRLGYRYAETTDKSGLSVQNRLLFEVTFRQTWLGVVTADRNGFDFRWTNGVYSTRYRNRLQLERTVAIHDYDLTPYANAEVAYQFSDARWSYVKYEAGLQLPVLRHFTAEAYWGYQISWTSSPSPISAVGLTLVFSY